MKLHPLRYWVGQTLRRMGSGWTIQLAAVGSIAVGLLLVGLVALGAVNLDHVTGAVGRGLHVTAYLRAGASPERVAALQHTLQRHPMVASVERITPEQAHRRLQESLGGRQGLLDGIEPDFLPASLELTLQRAEADRIRPLLALLSASSLVEEVDYLGQWTSRLSSIVSVVRGLGVALAVIVCLACLYIICSTIRLGLFARREEISILRLVGATERYVRAPFLMEGALQGLAGAMLACGVLYLLFRIAAPALEGLLAETLSHSTMGFLSPIQLLLGIGGGTLLGIVGSRVALARDMEG